MNTPLPPDPIPQNDAGTHPDYLWDRSGVPDPFVERLETLLAPCALRDYSGPAADPAVEVPRDTRAAHVLRATHRFALAATLILALGLAAWYFTGGRGHSPGAGWDIADFSGAPLVDGRTIRSEATLGVGQWLETDAASRARVRVASIGTLDIEPDSRLRIQDTTDKRHQVELAHGTISATINAPPRLFFVQTRAALATDMGCKYDLHMPESGPGLLTVRLGWVLLEGNSPSSGGSRWEARVPRGISCVIDEQRGPGTPFREGAAALRDALAPLDSRDWRNVSDAELDSILSLCGSDDGVTVWHILHRVDGAQRAKAYDRLALLVTLPRSIDHEDVLALDPETMNRLWSRVQW